MIFDGDAEINVVLTDAEGVRVRIDRFDPMLNATQKDFVVALLVGASGLGNVQNDEAAAANSMTAFECFTIKPSAANRIRPALPVERRGRRKQCAQIFQGGCEFVLDAQPLAFAVEH